ncbi:MAG: ketoacyl-ACP synthase III [Desulfobacteraceae bacterium]|jgi:3-oxoacyl-[acyl-carrier-protein] synthase III
MPNAAITGTGSYLPEGVIHNEALDQFPKTAKLIISQKTGVFCRHHADSDQCTSDLAFQAAKQCLERSDFPPGKVEAIILSTSSPDRIQPATATRLQHLLQATRSFAFDINSVCSGSTYGIALSRALIRSGTCTNVLFVASEIYSKILNHKDFATFPYFGDGAGAILFTASDHDEGVLASILRTDGSRNDTICIPGGGTMMPFETIPDAKAIYFQMKGREVYNFAVQKGTEVIEDLMKKTNQHLDAVQCFICHQANVNIILNIAENLGIAEEKFYMNMFCYGNTASASIPIALDEVIQRHIVAKGDLVVTAAFGGGLSWGANLIQI